jgi:hypothetical protein
MCAARRLEGVDDARWLCCDARGVTAPPLDLVALFHSPDVWRAGGVKLGDLFTRAGVESVDDRVIVEAVEARLPGRSRMD